MSEDADKARAAVENLLFQCAGGTPGQSLLIVHENKGDGFYGEDLHTVIADQAKKLGFLVVCLEVAFLLLYNKRNPTPVLIAISAILKTGLKNVK